MVGVARWGCASVGGGFGGGGVGRRCGGRWGGGGECGLEARANLLPRLCGRRTQWGAAAGGRVRARASGFQPRVSGSMEASRLALAAITSAGFGDEAGAGEATVG